MDRLEIKEILAQAELFKCLEGPDLLEMAGVCTVRTCGLGEYLFHQGDLGEHIYVVAEGHVCLERTMDLGKRKAKVAIAVLGKGKVFGCWSTLLGEAHHLMCSAFCQKPATLVVMEGPALRKKLAGDPRLGFCVLERLCCLLRERIRGVYGALEKI